MIKNEFQFSYQFQAKTIGQLHSLHLRFFLLPSLSLDFDEEERRNDERHVQYLEFILVNKNNEASVKNT